MHLLSNISSPSRANSYGAHYNKQNGSQSQAPPSAGFTLLQGHIQLMAMVPNLPENQVSPRWKTSSQEDEQVKQLHTSAGLENPKDAITMSDGGFESPRSLPITPRLMPSASKYKRPNLPTVLANKAAQNGFSSLSWHPPPSHNVVLPPTPSQPITMPSFAKCLPGTKRHPVGGINRMETSSCFPIIPAQPSYHGMSVIKEQMMEQSQGASAGVYVNPYTTCVIQPQSSQMGYQMVNVLPTTTNQQDLGAGGDHLRQVFLPVQQQPCYESPGSNGLYLQPNSTSNYMVMSYPQAPYAAQSVPCFGTYTRNDMHPRQSHNRFSIPCGSNSRHGHGIVLPPEPTELIHGARPVYSASMPEICLPPEPYCRSEQLRNSVPRLCLNKGLSIGSTNKQEVSVVLEDSSSDYDDDGYPAGTTKNEGDQNKTALLQMKPKIIMNQPSTNKASCIDEKKLAMLGPESLPTKIPSHPRVTHTPLRYDKQDRNEEDSCSNENRCCSRCKCHLENKKISTTTNRKEAVNTPRKNNNKSVVVAVHDCFPSDSSVTDVDSDLDSPKKSAFNCTVSGSLLRRRKPRMDTILHKSKLKGESEEVFEDLNDLSPDEVRLYTAEYLTELLSAEDWSNCYVGLQTMVRLARHRPKVLLGYLGPVLWFAFKHLTSAKSALCRAAIVTFKELFQKIGSALDNDLEKLTEKLVIKSLAPNRFIREECERALHAMVMHCSLIKVLTAMDIVSKKPHVRAACQKIAKMTKQFVQVAGVDTCLKSLYAEKLLPMLFGFMTEANNETRTAAKEALAMLMNHLQFEAAVTKHVTFDRNCTEVFKKLDKMRGRTRKCGPAGACRTYPLPHFRK